MNMHVMGGPTIGNQQVSASGRPMALPASEVVRFDLALAATDNSTLLTGATTLSTTRLDTVLVFRDLRLQSGPGDYELLLQARGALIIQPALTMIVHVRSCMAGEVPREGICQSCGHTAFNFAPGNCTLCERHGVCEAGLITPANGYWQSHPRSPHLHRCPVRAACTSPGRTAALQRQQQVLLQLALTANYSHQLSEAVTQYEDLQCNTSAGSTGPLCAVCKKDYGLAGIRCERCMAQGKAITAVAATYLVQSLIIAGQVALFLAAVYRMEDAAGQTQTQPGTSQAPAPGGGKPAVASRGGGGPKRLLQPHQVGVDGHISNQPTARPLVVVVSADDDGINQPAQVNGNLYAERKLMELGGSVSSNARSASALNDPHLAQATIIFKLLLQYVQLLGLMQGIAVDMPTVLLALVETADVTSAVDAQPLHCSFTGSSEHRLISYLVASVLIPLICLPLAAIMACLVPLRMLRSSTSNHRQALHIMAVSTMFTGLFFYPGVSRQLLRIFSFVRLDSPSDLAGAETPMLGMYWREYPANKYGVGPHLGLVLGLGLPGLLILSVGLPVTIVALLLPVRRSLQDVSVRRWLGMVYEDYKPHAFYWQAVVLMVQLLVTLCVVLLAGVGPQVQLLSAFVVMVLYDALHAAIQPLALARFMPLARITHISLMMSILLLLYISSAISERARAACGVLFVATNIMLVVGLLGSVMAQLIKSQRSRSNRP